MKIHYESKLKRLSRELRENSTLSEVLFWNELRARKMKGYQFMRQKPIGSYRVDFYCSKLNLIIEIDGDSHSQKFEEDVIRQNELEKAGLNFLRFDDKEVKQDINNVLRTFEYWIESLDRIKRNTTP